MSILVQFKKFWYFWAHNKKLDWMDYKNDQKLRKTSNANVLQNFAFADHIVSHNVEDTPKWTRKCSHNVSGIPLTMWRTNVNEDAYCTF